MAQNNPQLENIQITGPITPEFVEILTPEAMQFVATLVRAFEERREQLLQRRVQRQAEIDSGKLPDFLPETEHIRNSEWTIAPVPADLQDRRVEITGPDSVDLDFDASTFKVRTEGGWRACDARAGSHIRAASGICPMGVSAKSRAWPDRMSPTVRPSVNQGTIATKALGVG